ncbi:RelA/SpoT family protein [Porphyromonas macacae]|uniref:RelA/SpoT family protein n=1 Tax=Porphyromonas macacae TaxID=28115 RepID=UPI00359F915F
MCNHLLSLNMITGEERKELYSSARYLIRNLNEQIDRPRIRQIYTQLKTLYAGGAFTRDEHNMNMLLRQLGDARIVSEEIGLGIHAVLALLYYIPLKNAHLKEEDIVAVTGEEPVRLIKLLLKTSELYSRTRNIDSDNFQNLLLSIAQDIQVILLIIADRLYLLRYAKHLKPASLAVEMAKEASLLYAPMAHKLGLYTIKGEMEDLSLKYTDRKIFEFIKRKLGETKKARDLYIECFIQPVRERLEKELKDVSFEIKGRTKSISSIRNKLRKQQFEDIYDLFAIRIILDTPLERERSLCWQTYSIITDMFQPNPERLRDWISVPKSNGYESLHITVLGPDKRWVEVQIRTKRMDEIAELGVAAHWRYKGVHTQGRIDEFMNSVREVLEAIRYGSGGSDNLPLLKNTALTMPDNEIYVFTPQGAVINLPQGATVLDFAFAIHSRVGAQAVSAKVNGKNVPIKFKLQNGDSVEVITSTQQNAKPDWLSIVVSSKAKSKIRQILRAEEDAGISVAKETVSRRLKNRKIEYDDSVFIRLTKKQGYKTLSDFYRAVLHEQIDVGGFIDLYEESLKAENELREKLSEAGAKQQADTFVYKPDPVDAAQQSDSRRNPDVLVLDQNLTGIEYSLAQCCNPIYGDEVFGFVSNRGIKIHRFNCPNAPELLNRYGEKVITAQWSGQTGSVGYAISLEIIGRDDLAVVTNIISVIKKESRTKLRTYSIDSADSLFKGHFLIEVENRETLSILMRKLGNIVGVKHVERL